jgi:predicted 2-oxoglutarate/Fe(II)-dependent dioxygenase YbiX
MAGLAETRKVCVQSLRKAGKVCGAPLIRDTAAREKVVELDQAIQNLVDQ